ncbi:hypothetical protein M514_06984 [Trichuris suis]|uniref:Uncharacterized protein n=1 Tax=Trichuris suis TaxID=68888 RepID=A0A085N6R9_9BILA|nr:hypothetical protein M513_06984 [Trichuris suis]KFD65165.1 hypothetical protein M514_06984 [Trichuris suis]
MSDKIGVVNCSEHAPPSSLLLFEIMPVIMKEYVAVNAAYKPVCSKLGDFRITNLKSGVILTLQLQKMCVSMISGIS